MQKRGMLRNGDAQRVLLAGLMLSVLLGWNPPILQAAEDSSQQQLVDQARLTVEAFGSDPSMKHLL